ncbi:Formate/nitrite transporter [Halopenitus malekzadehii]|uniref:Formate/nitrite transporter n=1 Tax=Halopenitus malekzadehii TaxID=1267564 RepID=A0A1H6JLY0_9EURY|nr:Formate/nitrite transporter [Halopenitus malekzadehii]
MEILFYTEHTTRAVVPVLDEQASVGQLARLWRIVYVGNIVGGLVFTLLAVTLTPELGIISPEAFESIALIVSHGPLWLFITGIFAGWLMGLIAWLISVADTTVGRVVFVWLIIATITLLHLPHSIATNVEVLFGVLISSAITPLDYLVFLIVVTVGNAIGGSVFVTLIKYGHVTREGVT